jgi:spore cortex biosynthesis protein YabQ
MITSVNSQAVIFLYTVIGGAAVALVYDLFRILRKAVRTGSLMTYVQDLLFWLIVSVIMFLTIFYSNDGELRAYLFIGACIGVILYALLLSRIVIASSLFIIRIVSWPFRYIISKLNKR